MVEDKKTTAHAAASLLVRWRQQRQQRMVVCDCTSLLSLLYCSRIRREFAGQFTLSCSFVLVVVPSMWCVMCMSFQTIFELLTDWLWYGRTDVLKTRLKENEEWMTEWITIFFCSFKNVKWERISIILHTITVEDNEQHKALTFHKSLSLLYVTKK